ncbi:MAG: alcohol dehydrogenase catalytic domain-containing protein, partial [Pseudomonadota bacterium]|nr:alcohol dehydrogenase catalytic domain-containing protein [Pseudomonadota bacterium]
MKAVGFKNFGGPEVLEVIEVPEVYPGSGEIRIRNYASAVNPTDIVSRSGLVAQFQKDFVLPCVPGMDIAGVVDQVGEGVETGIKVGDNVMGMVV